MSTQNRTVSSANIIVLEKPLTEMGHGQFTVAIMSQMLHHLSPEEAVAMIKDADEKVTAGIIISDLIRSRFNYWLAKWSIALTRPNRFNNSDGPLSILRSYSDAEIKVILRQAGIKNYRIKNFLIRKIIIIYKNY